MMFNFVHGISCKIWQDINWQYRLQRRFWNTDSHWSEPVLCVSALKLEHRKKKMINGDFTPPALWKNIQATFRFGLHLSLNTILRDKNIERAGIFELILTLWCLLELKKLLSELDSTLRFFIERKSPLCLF